MASTFSRPSGIASMQFSQDLHHKMSKKLAQLTKVVYALHTRNDEHELTISLSRREHEDELQRLANDTRTRIETYKDALSRNNEYRVKIEALEACISEHKKQHATAMREFEKFQADVARGEAALKKQHREEVRRMTDALTSAKTQFETRLCQFSDIETSKLNANSDEMRRLKEKQQEEVDRINKSWSMKVSKLEQDIQKLRKISESAKDARDAVEAAQREMTEAIERERQFKAIALQQTSEKWKEEVKRKEEILAKEKAKFGVEKEALQNELMEWRRKYEEQEKKLGDMAGQGVNALALQEELEASRAEILGQERINRELRSDLASLNEVHEEMTVEMHNQAGQLNHFEATLHQRQQQIDALEKELTQLRTKSKLLENENGRLVASQKSGNDKQDLKLKMLERDLDQERRDKKDLKAKYAQEVEAAQVRNEHRETEIRQEFIAKISTLKKAHEQQLAEKQQELQHQLAALQQAHAKRREEEIFERKKCQQMIESQETQFRERESEMEEKIRLLELEIEMLRKEVNSGKMGLKSMNGEIQLVNRQLAKVSVEVQEKKEKIVELESTLQQKQTEIEQVEMVRKQSLSDNAAQLKKEKEVLAMRLENEWKDKFRIEMSKMTEQLTVQHRQEHTEALDRLRTMKDKEINALKVSMSDRMAGLHEQLDDTKTALHAAQLAAQNGESQIAELKSEQEVERMRLEEKHQRTLKDIMEKMELAHQQALQQEKDASTSMYLTAKQKDDDDHQKAMCKQREELLQEFVKAQSELEEKHQADLVEMETKYQNEIEIFEAHNKKLIADVDEQLKSHKCELDSLITEQKNEVTRIETTYQAARTSLQDELNAQKADCHQHSLMLTDQKSKVSSLLVEVGDLKQSSNQLREMLSNKEIEIDKANVAATERLDEARQNGLMMAEQAKEAVRAEADCQLRNLQQEFDVERVMFEEEMAKIHLQLAAVQELYDQRDSRPEDLEMIKELQWVVAEKDEAIVKLKEQQHFFRLELINREENLNRLFKASPRVGIIDPLQGKKKTKPKRHVNNGTFSLSEESSARLSPGTAARLAPLPGSPTVKHELRRSRPLPDPFLIEQAAHKPSERTSIV